MKVVILAGGRGTRFGSETAHCPKPLITVAGKAILLRVMEIYARQGFTDFIIATGYRSGDIHAYFEQLWDARGQASDDPSNVTFHGDISGQACSVTLADTGVDTTTGTRVGKIAPLISGDTFALTWCDGLADIDLPATIEFHKNHGALATVTAVNRRDRYGRFVLDGDKVAAFEEKPVRLDEWINGAFFLLDRRVLEMAKGAAVDWEKNVMAQLVASGELMAFKHRGTWQSMDMPRDRELLKEALATGLLKDGGSQ